MPLVFWDASSLIKRYFTEQGSATVNALFNQKPFPDMASTPWGYAETYSLLLRKFNGGNLDLSTWSTQVSALQAEVVSSLSFALFPIDSTDVFASTGMMRAHNLNATDAAILTVLVDYARSPRSLTCLLVAADQRLIRAAQAEGLATLNPEQVAPADVPQILSAL